MTRKAASSTDKTDSARPALLPFDPGDMMAMRVRPAEFARMCDVSRQSVSQWIAKGLIAIGPDGLIEPTKAARSVIKHSHPARLRARVFKLAAASYEELRLRVKLLEEELLAERGPLRSSYAVAIRYQILDAQAEQVDRFCRNVLDSFEELSTAYVSGNSSLFEELLDRMASAAFYPEECTAASAPALTDCPMDLLTGIAVPEPVVGAAEKKTKVPHERSDMHHD